MSFCCKKRQYLLPGVAAKILMSESTCHTINSQYLEPSCSFQIRKHLLSAHRLTFTFQARQALCVFTESWGRRSGVANITMFTCQVHQPPTLPVLLAPAWGCRSHAIFQKTFSKRACTPQSYGETTNPLESTVVSLPR